MIKNESKRSEYELHTKLLPSRNHQIPKIMPPRCAAWSNTFQPATMPHVSMAICAIVEQIIMTGQHQPTFSKFNNLHTSCNLVPNIAYIGQGILP